MADQATPEKISKADSGEVVIYHNAYVPTVEHEMPKSEWDRLAAEKLLDNAVFIRMKDSKK